MQIYFSFLGLNVGLFTMSYPFCASLAKIIFENHQVDSKMFVQKIDFIKVRRYFMQEERFKEKFRI